MKKIVLAIGILSTVGVYAQKKKTPVIKKQVETPTIMEAPPNAVQETNAGYYGEQMGLRESNDSSGTPTVGSYISSSKYTISSYKDSFGNYRVDYNDKYGYVNANHELVIPIIFNDIDVMGSNYKLGIGNSYNYRKYGLYNWEQKKWVVPTIYSSLSEIDANYIIAEKSNVYGIIDSQNKIIVPFEYDEIRTIDSGNDLMRMRKDNKYGIYSFISGKWIVSLEYDEIDSYDFKEKNYFKVRKNSNHNLLTVQNQLLFKNDYSEIEETTNSNRFIVTQNGKTGIIDRNEKVIVPIENQLIDNDPLKDGSYITKNKEGKIGSIDLNGKVSLPFEYDDYKSKSYDRFITTKDNKCGVIRVNDKSTTEILTCSYDNIDFMRNDIMIVQKDQKYGLNTTDGAEIQPLIYDEITSFDSYYSNNMIFKKGKEQWLANSSGTLISKPYEKIGKIGDQYKIYLYQSKGKEGLLSDYGTEYTEAVFEKIIDIQSNNIIIQSNKLFGVYNLVKKEYIVKPEYETVAFLSESSILVFKGGKFETINL